MKKIVKILIGIVSGFIIFIIGNDFVHADSIKFYKADYISNMFINRIEGKVTYYETARFIRRNSDDQFAYCIEPLAHMDGSVNYYSSNTYGKLSSDIVDKIKLAAYYGYGYSGHESKKWYAITQMLMWRYIEPNTSVYFTDKLNGNKTTAYDGEVNELKNLINNHYTRPSFNYTNNTININDNLILTDYNNVLSKYTIESTDGLNVIKSGNTLNISSNKTGNYNIKLVKKNNYYNPIPIFYLNGNSQDLLMTGNVTDVVSNLNINVTGGNITINKVDSENSSCKSQGDSKLAGAIYDIYQNGIVIDTLTINANCTATSKILPYGDYVIKEKSSGYGYSLDNISHDVTLNSSSSNIILTNSAKKVKVILTKLYGSKTTKEYISEANVDFGVYNSVNELLYSSTTDKNGITEFNLPYGNYTIKQLSTTKNYMKAKNIDLVINDNTNDSLEFELKDELLTTKLKVNKKDVDTGKKINDIAEFKILNKNTNTYVSDAIKNNIFKTDSNGVLLTDFYLDAGNYCLLEVKSPIGYSINNNCLDFSIDDNNQFVFYNNELYLEIDFFNKKEDVPEKEIILEKEENKKEKNIKYYSKKVVIIPDTFSNCFYSPIYIFYEKKKYI